MYDVIFHADWSVNPNKRWVAMAERRQTGWEISSLAIAPANLADLLLEHARHKRVFADFDFLVQAMRGWITAI
jgi:hypothetical protein